MASTQRYEQLLTKARLGAPADRSIPADLDQALSELSALRNVLVHRGARVDQRALRATPKLGYPEGELVRISRAGYKRYSAAVRAYGAEICRRAMMGLGPDVNLTDWRNLALAGA